MDDIVWGTPKVNIGKWKDAREVEKRKEISPVDIEEDRSRKRKDNKATGENEEEKHKILSRKDKIRISSTGSGDTKSTGKEEKGDDQQMDIEQMFTVIKESHLELKKS